MGAEHGVGEVLQGDRLPSGPVIQSWPDSRFFRVEAGEPAFTVLTLPVAAGVVTLVVATAFAWRVWFIERGAHPRRDLLGPSIVPFLVGGGFAPPPARCGAGDPGGVGSSASGGEAVPVVATASCEVGWLALVPGLPLLDLTRGAGDAWILPLFIAAAALSVLATMAARARDSGLGGHTAIDHILRGGRDSTMNVLVACATRHGSTAGIAERIAEVLTRQGHPAHAVPVDEAGPPEAYDAVVLGGAAYMFQWLKPALQYAYRHREALAARPVWLFSSGPLGTDQVDAEGHDVRAGARPREFDELTQALSPRGERVFFGAFDPTQSPIGLGERVTRAMPAAHDLLPGGDFRDWDDIEAWASRIAA